MTRSRAGLVRSRRPVHGLVAIAVAGLVATTGLIAVAAPAAGAATAYDFTAVHNRLNQATTNCAEVCGVVLGLERIGTVPGTVDVLVRKGYGNTAPTASFWTASAAKWLAGLVVESVIDDGLISLDSTVGQYFPAYAGTTKGGITLRQLMSHTHGFAGGVPCETSPSVTIQACAADILATDLVDQPGTAFRYSSIGMQIAGAMIELATGASWVQNFNDRVAGPLGMTSTGYASATNPNVGGGSPTNGLHSVADDYLRMLEMMIGHGVYRGTTIISPTAFATMTTDQTNGVPVVAGPGITSYGYGVGVWIEAIDGAGHTTRISSPGAFGMDPWYDLSRGYAGVILMQKDGDTRDAIMADIRPAIEQQIDTVPVGTPPPVVVTPVLQSLTPAKGPLAGGQAVTITGTGFTGATDVRFGSTLPAAGFTVVNDTTIVATSPARAAGIVNVLVTTPGGVTATSNGSLYQYLAAPTVTALSPTSGSTAGGTVVTITGTNFVAVSGVRFGPDLWASTFTVVSSTSVTVVTPARVASLVNVFVQTPGGLSASSTSTRFAYVAPAPTPVVTAVAPNHGPAAGGTAVTLTGTGFTGATGVRFGPSTWASTYTVVSDTRIDVVTPARAAALVNVYVRNANGVLSATSPSTTFLYQ